MQIVIDIPVGLKIDFENENWTALSCAEMKNSLSDGIVLPEKHGRLIDGDALTLMDVHLVDGVLVCLAPTIIEATED